jgi:hypothetical protein
LQRPSPIKARIATAIAAVEFVLVREIRVFLSVSIGVHPWLIPDSGCIFA